MPVAEPLQASFEEGSSHPPLYPPPLAGQEPADDTNTTGPAVVADPRRAGRLRQARCRCTRRPDAGREQAAARAPLLRGRSGRQPERLHRFPRYVNGKWLAANEIPADRSSVGRVRHAARALARACGTNWPSRPPPRPTPTGVEKIVGDFWATGMDDSPHQRQGHRAAASSRLAAIDALTDGPAIAEYLRQSAARGENSLFGFGPEPDFKNSTMNIAYAEQGGLGLPDRNYYFDADKKDELDAYRAHVGQGAGALRRARRPMPPSRPGRSSPSRPAWRRRRSPARSSRATSRSTTTRSRWPRRTG